MSDKVLACIFALPDDSVKVVQSGLSTDKIVPGDYDADGRADIAVFRGQNGAGTWFILRSSDNQAYVYADFGLPGDISFASLSTIAQ